uniref:Uncharacterized protein n=1 Tax=Anguilla anguilla TaxID=7936 RepID=A0A0E9WJD6_ANGAN
MKNFVFIRDAMLINMLFKMGSLAK